MNARHFAYIAAKLFGRREAFEALVALLSQHIRDTARDDREAWRAIPEVIKGFANGLRHRAPLTNPEIARTYRRHFVSYASPWWLSRSAGEIVLGRKREGGRKAEYYVGRARYYPEHADTLQFSR